MRMRAPSRFVSSGNGSAKPAAAPWLSADPFVLRLLRMLRNLGIEVIAILVGAGLIALLITEMRTSRIIIDAVGVPAIYRDRGLDGDVIAARVMDQVRALQREFLFSELGDKDPFEASRKAQDLQISVAGSSISIRSAAAYLKGVLCRSRNAICKPDVRFGGEITETGGGVQFRLRLPRGSFVAGEAASHIAAMWDLDRLLLDAARVIAFHRTSFIVPTISSVCALTGHPRQSCSPTELTEFERRRRLLKVVAEMSAVGAPAWRNATFQLAESDFALHRSEGSKSVDHLMQAINRIRRLYEFHAAQGRIDPATVLTYARYLLELDHSGALDAVPYMRSGAIRDEILAITRRAGEMPWKIGARGLIAGWLLGVDVRQSDSQFAAVAEQLLDAEIRGHGASVDLLLNLARARLRQDRGDDAAKSIEAAIALAGGRPWHARITSWFKDDAAMPAPGWEFRLIIEEIERFNADRSDPTASRLKALLPQLLRLSPPTTGP